MSLEKLFRDREIRKSILESVDINTPCHKGYCEDCGEYKTLYQIYDRLAMVFPISLLNMFFHADGR